MNTYGVEKATTIRQPSTANLMISSADRSGLYSSCWDFQITKNQSLFNGFFSRIGTTEVVLEWCEDNIRFDLSNNFVRADVSGVPVRITIPQGSYTVEKVLQYLAVGFNDLSGVTKKGCSIFPGNLTGGSAGLQFTPSAGLVLFSGSELTTLLDLNTAVPATSPFINGLAPLTQPGNIFIPDCPDLRLYRFLDFTSEDLTYSQDLKDNSTLTYNRDVLVRWYMDDDVPEAVDGLGFPIYMGYLPFRRRRLFNPPKQIKWDANLPIGNLRFSVYDDQGAELPVSDDRTNWLMTLQLSEN